MLEGRIDAVVLSVDSAQRENKIEIVEGIVSGSPVRPEMPNSEEKHCYPLAYVTIDVEAETITNDKIQNVVGLTPTPYVTGILQTANVDNLYSSWENRFNTWFEGVQGLLDGDVAVNLTKEISDLKQDLTKVSNLTFPISEETKEELNWPEEYGDGLKGFFKYTISSSEIVSKTETFTTGDHNSDYIAMWYPPKNLLSLFVTCVGNGGKNGGYIVDGNLSIDDDLRNYIYGGAGGSGNIVTAEIDIFDVNNVGILIKIPSKNSLEPVSFGTYVSAEKGEDGYPAIVTAYNSSTYGGRNITLYSPGNGGDGYAGGGAGGILNPSWTSSSAPSNHVTITTPGNGGNGFYGGGGGGGGGNNHIQGSGGNGGIYGGGGGGNGNGGQYGGNGGNYIDNVSAENGVDTSELDEIIYKGFGLAGLPGTKTISNVTTECSSGGGGGYGGNGGNGGKSNANHAYTSESARATAGNGGGGGYGGNGGDGGNGNVTFTINSGSSTNTWTYGGGGGGGGYGGSGENATHHGGGGGGYGPNNYGRGGSTGFGAQGVVIVQYTYRKFRMEAKE